MATPKKKPTTAETPIEEEAQIEQEAPSAEQPLTVESIQAMINQAVSAAIADQKAVNEQKDQKIAELEKRLAEKDERASMNFGNGDVCIVYLSDSPGVINKGGLDLRCGTYGEEFTLSRYQFDQLVGHYRSWFDKGILAVSRNNIDVAARKGLRTQDEFALKPSQLKRIGTMPVSELRKLWNDCVNDNERMSIVTYYKRKFIEGKEPGFRESERVLLMNTLTKQGLKREAIEISGASLKIGATDFASL